MNFVDIVCPASQRSLILWTGRGSTFEIVTRAFSTSDFPYLLANVANKSLANGYETAPESWQQIVRIISVSDFKQLTMVGMSEFSDAEVIAEGQEYTYGSMSDARETFAISKVGRLFSLTRESIINDDLNALSGVPQAMGRSIARKVGDLVWGVITANANMIDGTALFHANHSNLGSGAITVASLDSGVTAMAKQKDISGVATLNITPSFLIVPRALLTTSKVLMAAQWDPDATNKLNKPNPFSNNFTVVSDARLDNNSTTAWYLSANPNQFDTIVVGFLNGVQTPALEQQAGWAVDGIEFKCRLDVGAKAVGYKGLWKSTGT